MNPGSRHSADTRAKMSAAHKGNTYARGVVHTAERRAQIVAQMTGRPVSAETRAKIGDAHRGRVHSEASRANMAAASTGRVFTPEHRAKIGAALVGKRHAVHNLPPAKTAATRLKLHLANIGKKLSGEHRAKLSAAKVGKAQKPEAVERRRQALTGSKWTQEARARFSEMKQAAFAEGRISISPETRRKATEGLKRAWADGRLSVPRAQRYTKLAQALHAHLTSTGLTLEPEVRFGRYTVDLYDRAHHIAYEADGGYWHDKNELDNPGSSAKRDEYLIQFYGLKIVHFIDKEISALTGWPNKKKKRVVA